MSVKLTELHSADESECLLMESELEDFGGRELGDDMQGRILSSVMGKAGFDMKENITVNKTKKINKRLVGFMIAAAVFATGAISAGAYAYTHLINRSSVEMYLENADRVEASGKVENQVMENEHVRITLDTVISDGYKAMAVVTLDALDDYGKNLIEGTPNIMLRRTDTGETVFPSGGGGMDDWEEQIKNDTGGYYYYIDLPDMDLSCDYEMIFYSYPLFPDDDEETSDGYSISLDENMIPVDNPLGYDFIANVNLTKNVDTVTLTGTNGKEITLSQFELISEDKNIWNGVPETLALIRNDGTTESFDEMRITGLGWGAYSSALFGKFIEIDEYKGVEINGVQYLKQE